MIYPNDLRTTLFSEIAEIIEEGGDCSPYDVVDFMISIMNEDQLRQLEDVIVNQYSTN
jgi:hypothetical protein|tara:strand:- start:660 stop:833 length:174 start_codon:yes stop_codon:yes gene_type:complete